MGCSNSFFFFLLYLQFFFYRHCGGKCNLDSSSKNLKFMK